MAEDQDGPRGMIDPALHRVPPAPLPHQAPSPSAPEQIAEPVVDRLELGPGVPARRRVRVVAGVAAVVLVCAGLVVAGLGLRDRRETVASDGLIAAAHGLRPDSRRTSVEPVAARELSSYRPQDASPAACLDLIQPGGDSVADAVHWEQRHRYADDIEVLALRYDRPVDARAAVSDLATALDHCPAVAFGYPDESRAAYTVERVPLEVPDALAYELTGDGQTYGSYLRRFGNVVVWTVGRGADGDPSERTAADDLVAELQRRARV